MPKQPKHIFHPERLLATIACLAVAGLGVNLISAAFKGEDAKQPAEPVSVPATPTTDSLAKVNLIPEKQSTAYRDTVYNFLQQEGIEGFRSKPYLDIYGNLTIGVGFKISKDSAFPWSKYPALMEEMSENQAREVFEGWFAPDTEKKILLYSHSKTKLPMRSCSRFFPE